MTLTVRMSLLVFNGAEEQIGGLNRTLPAPAFLPRAGETVDVFAESDMAVFNGYPSADVEDVTWTSDLSDVDIQSNLVIKDDFIETPWLAELVAQGWTDWWSEIEPGA